MKAGKILVVAFTGILYASTTVAQSIEWIEQFGSSEYDLAVGVSADGLGNIYITGSPLAS